jgi:arginyl-tRNA synthetase
VYEKLNIHFDVFWGESQVSTESMDRAIRVVQEKGLTKFKMDRAIVRKGGKYSFA